jgi:hypothetical protein
MHKSREKNREDFVGLSCHLDRSDCRIQVVTTRSIHERNAWLEQVQMAWELLAERLIRQASQSPYLNSFSTSHVSA